VRAALFIAARIAVLPTAALAIALVALPSRAELLAHIWLLLLLTAAALAGLGALRKAFPRGPSSFEPDADEPTRHGRFPSLARVEREVTLAAASAYDVHFRLCPTLRTVSAELLAARRGVALDLQPERSLELLGAETWELVRADREPPSDPRGPGLESDALERVVASLERI
jgi:hypothetical protein